MTTQPTTDHAARAAKPTQPEYSEYGPVFIAKSYETTDECAPSSRITWSVQDLDDRTYALDCSEQNAKCIAHSLNCHHPLLSALTDAIRAMYALGWDQASPGYGNREAYEAAASALNKAKAGAL